MGIPILTPVQSSNIEAVGWDSEAQELHVRFANGSTYAYIGAPESLHDELIGAASCGSCFAEKVRNKFEFRKL